MANINFIVDVATAAQFRRGEEASVGAEIKAMFGELGGVAVASNRMISASNQRHPEYCLLEGTIPVNGSQRLMVELLLDNTHVTKVVVPREPHLQDLGKGPYKNKLAFI